jgi:hypothetical protein
VTSIRIFQANDFPARDPASYVLEGSNDGFDGVFTTIASGPLNLPNNRNGSSLVVTSSNSQLVTFTNTTAFTTYRIIFPTIKDASSATSMQVAEVQLFAATF